MRNSDSLLRRWAWAIIGLHLIVEVIFIGLAIAYLNLGFSTQLPAASYRWGLYLLYALVPLAAIGFAIDRNVVADETGWTPSRAYYLLSLPFVFNIAISAHYLYRRHQRMGVP